MHALWSMTGVKQHLTVLWFYPLRVERAATPGKLGAAVMLKVNPAPCHPLHPHLCLCWEVEKLQVITGPCHTHWLDSKMLPVTAVILESFSPRGAVGDL